MPNLGHAHQRINRAKYNATHLQFIMTFPGFSCLLSQRTNIHTQTQTANGTAVYLFVAHCYYFCAIFILISFVFAVFVLHFHRIFALDIFPLRKSKQMNKGNIICVMQWETNAYILRKQYRKKRHKTKRAGKMVSFKLMKSLDMYLICCSSLSILKQ